MSSSQRLVPASGRAIVVVLGMHRSGTSLLSNVLHFLGVDMADLTDHVSPKNAGGFWERPELTAIHDEILAAIERPISRAGHALPFPPGWWRRKEVQAIKPRLIAYLSEQLAKSSNLWGFKDPRTCRLLPLWWEVFRDMNLRPIYVHALRTPAEASASMAKKSKVRKVSVATSELMWLSYNYDILRYVTSERPPILVDYDEWFADGAIVARRLVEGLGIGSDLSLDDAAECVDTIVNGEYRHQVAGGGDVASTMPLAMMLYRAMVSDTSGQASLSQLPTLDLLFRSIKPVMDQLDADAAGRAEFSDKLAATELQRAELETKHKQYVASQEKHSEKMTNLLRIAQEQDTGAIKALQEQLLRHAHRARSLLKIAQDWRSRAYDESEATSELHQQYEIACGEISSLQGRVDGLVADKTLLERRLVTLDDRNHRLIDLADDNQARIAQLERSVDLRSLSDAPVGLPQPGEMPLSLDGRIDRVDYIGVSGRVRLQNFPDIAPIVEVRVNGNFVFARSSGPALPQQEGYSFLITWRSLAPNLAGHRATLHVPGADQVIGHFDIPDNLSIYHASPAERAVELFGGTIAETQDYHRWIAEHETVKDMELARSFASRGDNRHTFTVWIFGANEADFVATIRSLSAQIYGHWEALCLGASEHVEQLDPRVRCIDAAQIPSTLELYEEDALFTFAEAGDLLAPTALLQLGVAVDAYKDFSLIYSDEDRIDLATGVRADPYMKGNWNSDLALAQDYICRLALMRRGCWRWNDLSPSAVYRTALACALDDETKVVHLPFLLYHRSHLNVSSGHDLPTAVEDAALHAFPDRFNQASIARAGDGEWSIDWALPAPAPRVSLIVPTRDRVDLLRVSVDGFLHDTVYPDLEIIIADNESVQDETKAYFHEISKDSRVRIVSCPGPFNYSVINNLAASHASGSVIGLMNNDLKVIHPDWLTRMTARVLRPEIGIVGAKLLYGDDTVQHAGVTLGIGLASHLYKGFPATARGRHGRLMLSQDVTAVTAACLLIRKEVWVEAGGLEETLPVAYNDVDLCLKVSAAGYRILWAAEILLYHLESQSRGMDISSEKRERLESDKQRMKERWGRRLDCDPFYSPNLSIIHSDASLANRARVTPPWREVH